MLWRTIMGAQGAAPGVRLILEITSDLNQKK